MLSNRTKWNLTKNKLTQLLEVKRKNKITVFDFTESNPTQGQFNYPEKEILDSFNQPQNLLYSPHPKGLLKARNALVDYYKSKSIYINSEQMYLLSSTSEGYSMLFRLLADPGDFILVPRPSYPLFDMLAKLNDIHLQYYDLIYESYWKIDLDSIEKNIGHRTKAILLVNPNNPTGSFIKDTERKILVEISQKHELALISDEVFSDYYFQDSVNLCNSFTNVNQVLTFTLNGISKMLALPQMKLAWMYCNGPMYVLEEVLSRLEMINDCYLSLNTPVQNALPQLLELRYKIQRQINNRILNNYNLLLQEIISYPNIQCLKSEGGWYATILLNRDIDEENFVLNLLDKENILLYPGYFYDFPSNGFFVLSLLLPQEIFQQGLQRIFPALNNYTP